MHIRRNHLLNLGAVLLTIGLQSNPGIAQNFRTIGYFPTYRFGLIDNIELNRLTHLNIAFANPDGNGYLATDGVDIESVVQKAHEAELEVFIALAGAGAQLSDWEGRIDSTNRSSFIHNIVNFAVRHELQGIDVDLEWGNVNDDYSGFVLELKDSLDQYGMKMTAAFPGAHRYAQVTDEALSVFEWINIMAYDLTGDWTPDSPGPHSPYSYAENSISYWVEQGVDKQRLALGVPFYGYDFTDQNNITAVTFSEMVNMDTAYAQIDQVGEIYYNGLSTIEQKTLLALDETNGIMIWEIGQDYFGEYSLLKRIDETIEEYLAGAGIQSDKYIGASVYPNPVSDIVHIRMDTPQNIKIILFSSSQKVLKEQYYYNQELISVGLDDIPGGIYFLMIEGKNYTRTFKLAKIK